MPSRDRTVRRTLYRAWIIANFSGSMEMSTLCRAQAAEASDRELASTFVRIDDLRKFDRQLLSFQKHALKVELFRTFDNGDPQSTQNSLMVG